MRAAPGRPLLGVIGHVDHGKTALVRALTGIETDRLAEEKRRGISIALGFAHLALDGAEIDFVDMPGHERFVRTMVAGATGLDAVLMVVAANEGVMPQTREHAHIAALLGVERAVIAISKSDLASADEAALAGLEASELAAAAGLRAAPPIPCSALSGENLGRLRAAIAAVAAGTRKRPDLGFAWLPVDRAFSLPGQGTIVTGTLRRGSLRTGEEAALLPGGRKVRIRALQVHGAAVEQVGPGGRVAANLRATEVAEAPRGAALARPGLITPARWLSVRLRAIEGAPPLPTGARLQLLYGTDETEVRLRLLDRETLEPGATGFAQLHGARPVWVPGRERFILRSASPPATLGGGVILDPAARRLRRHSPEVLAHLAAIAEADPAAIAMAEMARAGATGLDVGRLARLCGCGPERALDTLGALPAVLCAGRLAVAAPLFERLCGEVRALLATGGPRPSASLAAGLPGVAPAVLEAALARLAAAGAARREAGGYSIIDAGRDRARAVEERALAARLEARLREGGLTPPDLWSLATDAASRRALDRLVREGVAVRGHDESTRRDFLFHQDAIERAQRVLRPLLAEGPGLLVRDIGAALGISRKYSMPLIDHLDRAHFTRRVGDRRQLRPPAPGS